MVRGITLGDLHEPGRLPVCPFPLVENDKATFALLWSRDPNIVAIIFSVNLVSL